MTRRSGQPARDPGGFLTTGEAAALLNVSRSTVSRYFDQGLIQGEVNRITGQRLVSAESLTAFMKERGLRTGPVASAQKHIVLATADSELEQAVETLVSTDERLHLRKTAFGSDALVACSQKPPDLLVLCDDIEDISCSRVAESLRRQLVPEDLKILCCTGDVSERWRPCGEDGLLCTEPLDVATLKEQVYRLLGLPQDSRAGGTVGRYQRRWPRLPVNLAAEIEIYCLAGHGKRSRGTGVVTDISRDGAYLAEIALREGHLPATPFRVLLRIDEGPLSGWQAHCRVVRLSSNGSLAAGLRFVRISRLDQRRIADMAMERDRRRSRASAAHDAPLAPRSSRRTLEGT